MRRTRRQPRVQASADWHPTLRWIIDAADHECPRGHAGALRDLTALAMHKVPARGIFDPAAKNEDELFASIESIAQTHLDLAEARDAWRAALDAAALSFERRDELEQAALQVRTVSDTAYFYAGLAFGLAFVCLSRQNA